MNGKRRFEHNSVQDVESVVDYLRAVIKGFERGELEFAHGEDEIKVHPQGLLAFGLEASAKGNRRKVKIKIRWREGAKEEEPVSDPLIIRAGSE